MKKQFKTPLFSRHLAAAGNVIVTSGFVNQGKGNGAQYAPSRPSTNPGITPDHMSN